MPMSQTLLKPVDKATVAIDGVMDVATIVDDARMIMDHRKVVRAYTGGARQHNGSNQYFTLADNATVGAVSTGLWMCAFVYPDLLAGSRTIGGHWDTTGSDKSYQLFASGSDGQFRVSSDGSAESAVGFATLTLSAWTFLFGWHDGSKIYVRANNGSILSAVVATLFDAAGAFGIGAQGNGGQHWPGRLALVAMGKISSLGDGTAGSLALTISTRLFNKGNGLNWGSITAAERTAWGLTAGNGVFFPGNEDGGNLVENVAGLDATDTNTVTATNGPRVSQAEDISSNSNHGILTDFSDSEEINAWVPGPDGTQSGREDDTSGVNTDHGRLEGPPTLNSSVPAVLSGSSIDCDGTDDRVVISAGQVTALDSTSAFTISQWFNQTTLDQGRGVFEKRTSGTAGVNIQTYTDGELYVVVRNTDSSSAHFDYSAVVTAGAWHHLAIVFDGALSGNANRLKVYIDAVQQTLTFSGTIPATTADLSSATTYIGDNPGGGVTEWLGLLKDCRIFSSALSSANITSLKDGTDFTTGIANKWLLGDTLSVPNVAGGSALDFPGVDEYVSIADYQPSGLTEMSFACWFQRQGGDGTTRFLFCFDDNDAAGWGANLRLNNTNDKLRWTLEDGSASQSPVIFSNVAYTDILWHHVVCTWKRNNIDSTDFKIFVDGMDETDSASFSANSYSVSTETRTDATAIGGDIRYISPASEFFGLLDDARIYETQLTAANVESLFTGTNVGTPDLHVPFDDGPQGQGGTIVDGDRVVIVDTADGNRWTFSQTTPASCPTWRVIGTRGQLEFDGVDDYLQYPAADISTSAVGECIIVFHADNSGTLFSMTDAAVVNQRWQVIRDTSSLMSLEYHNGVTQDNIDGSTTVSVAQERMGGWGSSGTAITLTVDNNNETEAIRTGANNGNWIGDVTGPDNFTIGAQEISVGVGEELSGNIEMILLMDRELTAAERTLLASVYP